MREYYPHLQGTVLTAIICCISKQENRLEVNEHPKSISVALAGNGIQRGPAFPPRDRLRSPSDNKQLEIIISPFGFSVAVGRPSVLVSLTFAALLLPCRISPTN